MDHPQYDVGMICHVGKTRAENEDSVLCTPEMGLWVVADGVGGGACGQMASQLATQTIDRRVRQGQGLDEAMREAHETVRGVSADNRECKGMASTAVACRLLPHQNDPDFALNWSWIGDSRLYLHDGQDLIPLTQDHNVAAELLAKGEITEAEASRHRSRHVLTQAIGSGKLRDVPIKSCTVRPGQRLLLCSDGLCGVLSDTQIANVLDQIEHAQTACDTLFDQVMSRGAPDNISIVLVSIPAADPENSNAVKSSSVNGKKAEAKPKAVRESEDDSSALATKKVTVIKTLDQPADKQEASSPARQSPKQSVIAREGVTVRAQQKVANKGTSKDAATKTKAGKAPAGNKEKSDAKSAGQTQSSGLKHYLKQCKSRLPYLILILLAVLLLFLMGAG